MQMNGCGSMLFVKDFDVMTSFYEGHLGLEPDVDSMSDGWRRYPVGNGSFALHAVPAQYATDIVIASPPEPRSGVPLKAVFTVKDLAEACAELDAQGVRRLNPELNSNGYFVDYLDPEGNVFQVSAR